MKVNHWCPGFIETQYVPLPISISSLADKPVQERDIVAKLNLGYPNLVLVLDQLDVPTQYGEKK
jgi:hypothetical protein